MLDTLLLERVHHLKACPAKNQRWTGKLDGRHLISASQVHYLSKALMHHKYITFQKLNTSQNVLSSATAQTVPSQFLHDTHHIFWSIKGGTCYLALCNLDSWINPLKLFIYANFINEIILVSSINFGVRSLLLSNSLYLYFYFFSLSISTLLVCKV